MGLYRIVSEINGNFSRKSRIFPTPSVFDTTLKGFPGPSPWNWVPEHVVKKLQWWAAGQRKKFDDIIRHLDTKHERDRETDTADCRQ